MAIQRTKAPMAQISTASLPDIIFLLLIFFMVTSVFRQYRGIPVRVPAVVNALKIDGKRNLTYCYIDASNRISVDDKLMSTKDLTAIMYMKRTQNPRLIVNMKVDEMVKNGFLGEIYKSLQDADARRIVYGAKSK